MDVSPKTLREVEFREKMRGYHPEDVDQFLERVAAGIEVLQDRLRQAIERAQRAEQAATEAGGNDETLRRTLVLAQRTADLAVQEGREQAARIVASAEQQFQAKLSDAEQRFQSMVSEAESRAQSTLADAERRASGMLAEAEQSARRGHEDALVEVRAELARLEATRQRVQADIDAMTRWVAEHRNSLRSALEDALSRVEKISVRPPPATGGAYVQDNQAPARSAPAPAAVSVPGAPAAPGPGGSGGSSGPRGSGESGVPAAASGYGGAALTSVGAGQGGTPGSGPDQSAAADSPWRPPTSAPSPGAESAPRSAAVPETAAARGAAAGQAGGGASENGGDADPYFAELRRAISDHGPLGPGAQDPNRAG